MPEPIDIEEVEATIGLINLDALAQNADIAAAIPRQQAAKIVSIASIAKRGGIEFDAAEAIRRGIDPLALGRAVQNAMAARDEASAIVPITPTPSTAGIVVVPGGSRVSPIVEAVRRTAAEQRPRDVRR